MHTDHNKITYAKSTSRRVMRWSLLIEGFGPKFRYIKGTKHIFVIADDLSLLEKDDYSDESTYLEKHTAQCASAIISRSEILSGKLNYHLQQMVLKWLNPVVSKQKRKPKMRITSFLCKFPTLQKFKTKINR
jgi:hypothetical protein